MGKLGGNATQIGKGVGQVAGGLTRLASYATIAAVGAVGASAKIAAGFEDAFAAVEKTVEGTPAQLAKIDQGLRDLSTQIPVTFQGLATIASEAGALGVATEDIVKFTEAVARTSAATVGLSEFDASEAFGKLSTVFGLHGETIDKTTGRVISDFERLGSALVALGNAGASSESEIIGTARYLAGAGQAAGLSADQVLAWSSAVTSLGVAPEAAGGALSRIFQKLTTNIGTGEKAVRTWAKVSDLSVKEFVALYDRDASGAVVRFLQHVGELDKFEQARALKRAGLINQRDISAVTRLIENMPVLIDQLALSNEAWDKGTELMSVSERRFDTLKSHWTEFVNQVKVGAAAFGEGMTPAIDRAVTKFKAFIALNMGNLTEAGREFGEGIDSIDWAKVEGGARTFIDLLKAARDVLSKIPADVLAIGAGFIAANRLSGGLLAAGAANIVAGVGKAAFNVATAGLSRVPGVGGILGAATATRVFVVNWPAGFGVGPAGPGGTTAPGTLGSAFAALGIALIPVAAAGLVMGSTTPAQQQAEQTARRRATAAARGLDPSAVPDIAPGIRDPLADWAGRDRDAVMGVTSALNANTAALNSSGSPDERDERNLASAAAVTSAAAAALNAALAVVPALARGPGGMLDPSVKGRVPTVHDLVELGEKGDPFGFKHLKAFALGQIPMRIRDFELRRHLDLIQDEIREARQRGDERAIAKLQETKAGLEHILGQIKDGTFRAGDKAYRGALVAARAADRTRSAIETLPVRIAGALARIMAQSVGSALAQFARTFPDGGGSSSQTYGGVRRHARGTVGLAKVPTLGIFGEAEDEAVSIVRHPRGFDPRESGTIILRPQPISLSIDGREVIRAIVGQESFTRRAPTG